MNRQGQTAVTYGIRGTAAKQAGPWISIYLEPFQGLSEAQQPANTRGSLALTWSCDLPRDDFSIGVLVPSSRFGKSSGAI